MSHAIRVVIIIACAYAGSALAGAQFQPLPDARISTIADQQPQPI